MKWPSDDEPEMQWLVQPVDLADRPPRHIDPEIRAAMDDYRGRVQATVWESADWVSLERRERAQHLIEHGEPAEGMRALAFAIVEEGALVPRSLIAAIRELSEGLVDEQDMPEDLDDFGIDEPTEGSELPFADG